MSIDIQDSIVAVPNGEIFVRQWVPAEAQQTPIILLHDSLGSVAQWRDFPQELALSAGRTVAAYDRLGYGQSTPQKQPADIDFIEHEAGIYLPALASALGLSKYILFGHSVGGGMALTAAAKHPQQCLAVISVAAQAFVETRTLEGIRKAKAAFAHAVQFERLARWHGERAQWVLDAWTEVWLSPAFHDWSLNEVLAAVKCPVLAIHGDKDEFGSLAFPQQIINGVAGPSEMVILPDCGHVPHREQKSKVLNAVATFLSGSD